MLESIAPLYGFDLNHCKITSFGNGLINKTYILETEGRKYILQKINTAIFKSPELIAVNIHQLNLFFKEKFPDYLFVHPISTLQNDEMVLLPDGEYYRIFPFIEGSLTFNFVDNIDHAFEAAKQFGKFTRLLSTFKIDKLGVTLPDFHNLDLRYQQFEIALSSGNSNRINDCASAINFMKEHKNIVEIFNTLEQNINFKKRVTHNDTKISNVLFDTNGKAICVIDLDTVMPGYFISDVGDMLRTYLSPVSEEENDLSKIDVRVAFFDAIMKGYLSEMKDELSNDEKTHFVYAGKFMIYMQALRFLTDHFNNDVYYGSQYNGQNLIRCNNQIELLKQLLVKEDILQQSVLLYLSENG